MHPYLREQVILGPTHLPSPTHIALKKPSMLYPSEQEYVSWVPSGKILTPVGPSCVACGTTGGSRHFPAMEKDPTLFQLICLLTRTQNIRNASNRIWTHYYAIYAK